MDEVQRPKNVFMLAGVLYKLTAPAAMKMGCVQSVLPNMLRSKRHVQTWQQRAPQRYFEGGPKSYCRR